MTQVARRLDRESPTGIREGPAPGLDGLFVESQ